VPALETEKAERNYEELPPLGISGFGGWLVLVQIGLFLTLANLNFQIFQNSLPSFGPEIWNVLTSRDSDMYHPLWAPIIVFEAIYNVLFLLFSLYAIVSFYQKKAIVPRLMIIFYGISFLIGAIDTLLVYQIPAAKELDSGDSIMDIVRSFITCLIWIPYFLKSERVKNTFIR
jgi:hypothetical protein